LKLFDTVIFLLADHTVYLGLLIDVLSHFAFSGFESKEHENQADLVLYVLIDSK
jgi:hypothetical protein